MGLFIPSCGGSGGGGGGGLNGYYELYIYDDVSETYEGPFSIMHVTLTGGSIILNDGFTPLPMSGNSFSGWLEGDEQDGLYFTGTVSGGVINMTGDYWFGGVIDEVIIYRLERTSILTNGTVSASSNATTYGGQIVNLSITPAFGDEWSNTGIDVYGYDSSDNEIYMELESPDFFVPDTYTAVDWGGAGTGEIGVYIDIAVEGYSLWANLTGGTVTITSYTAGDRIVGTYDLTFSGSEELSGSFSVPLLSSGGGTPPDADAYEPDNSWSEATSITVNGGTQTHTLTERDQDWVKFTVTSTSTTYYMETSNLQSGADTYMYLYSTNGTTLLDENDDYIDLESRIDYVFPSTGTYYVMIEHFDLNGTGQYDLEVRTTP